MNDDAYYLLVEMVQDAYRACKSEAMSCPWCSGYISSHREEHDEHCQFQKHRHMFEDGETVLTGKGVAAVEQMDDRYKELCRQMGTDPGIWQPDVWVRANEG